MTICLFLLEGKSTGPLPLLREINTPEDGEYFSDFIPADMRVCNMSIIGPTYVHVYLKRKEAA